MASVMFTLVSYCRAGLMSVELVYSLQDSDQNPTCKSHVTLDFWVESPGVGDCRNVTSYFTGMNCRSITCLIILRLSTIEGHITAMFHCRRKK